MLDFSATFGEAEKSKVRRSLPFRNLLKRREFTINNMRNLQETGTYLEEKAKLHGDISIIFFAIGGLGLLVSFLITNFTLIFIFIISLFVGGVFLKFYLNYNNGLQGEQITTETLQNLPDS